MDRFEVVSISTLTNEHKVRIGSATVLRDIQTGVLYLWCKDIIYNDTRADGRSAGAGIGGLTVMLDQDGKPATMHYTVNI